MRCAAASRSCVCDDNKTEGGCCRQDRRRAGRRKRAELLELLRPCFARTEPWLQAGKYAAAVMSELRRRNGWTIAEHRGTGRRTGRSGCSTAQLGHLRGDGRGAPVRGGRAGRGRAQTGRRRGLAIGAIDETGQEKAGTRTAGVKRQYLGCAGKVANGINTVHLSYVREGPGTR